MSGGASAQGDELIRCDESRWVHEKGSYRSCSPPLRGNEDELRVADHWMALPDRAGRWVTEQVGRHAWSIDEIAVELGSDRYSVNDTVMA